MKPSKTKKAFSALLSLGIALSSVPCSALHAADLTLQDGEQSESLVNVAALGTPWGETEGRNHDAGLMTDGKTNTFWMASSTSLPVSAGIHLDRIYAIDSIHLVFEPRPSTNEIMGFAIESKIRRPENGRRSLKGPTTIRRPAAGIPRIPWNSQSALMKCV